MLTCLKDMGVGFTTAQVDTVGSKIVNTISEVLWYIDPFHERLRERKCPIPKPFSTLHNYKDWRKQHKKEPRVSKGKRKFCTRFD